MGERFDQHRLTNFPGLNTLISGSELGVKAAHKAQLEAHAGTVGGIDDAVTFSQRQRRRFFQEEMLARSGCHHCQRVVCGGRGGDDDRVKHGLFQRLF